MNNKELELIEIITSGFKGSIIAAINHCIQGMDSPLSIRNMSLSAVLANECYLDTMKRTRPGFERSSVVDVFSPDDRLNGVGHVALCKFDRVLTDGHADLVTRIWDGKDVFCVAIGALKVGEWVVTSFNPRSGATLLTVPTVQNSASHPSPHTDRTLMR